MYIKAPSTWLLACKAPSIWLLACNSGMVKDSRRLPRRVCKISIAVFGRALSSTRLSRLSLQDGIVEGNGMVVCDLTDLVCTKLSLCIWANFRCS